MGLTLGFGRHHGTYVWHGQTKHVAVRPLVPQARAWLTAVWDAPALIAQGGTTSLSTESLVHHPRSLMARLAVLPDVRKPRGVRHAYITILTVALAAIAAGCTSLLAIGEWAATLTQDQLATLQAARWKGRYVPPSEAAIRRALQRSDAEALDRILTEWMSEQGVPDAVAFDGKTVRGSRSETAKARHLVSAVVHGTTRVLAQTEVDEKSNEIPAAYPLLDPLDLQGALVTGDAMHTQRDLATYLVEDKHADYLFIAKGNQPTLEADIRALSPDAFSAPAETLAKGHGRIEHRSLRASTALNDYLNFPYTQQVFILERTTTIVKTGQVRQETVVGVTSRPSEKASSKDLLDAVRQHWTIENKVHWVRDVDWQEDKSRVRTGAAPHILASFRNAVLSWLDLKNKKHIARQLRQFAWDKTLVIALVTEPV